MKKMPEAKRDAPNGSKQPRKPLGRSKVIKPDRMPSQKVTMIDLGPNEPHPIDRAERQLNMMKVDFPIWLEEDRKKLVAAWKTLRASPENADAFLAFTSIIHTIKGNAALMGCEIASQLAMPVAHLLEHVPDINHYRQVLDLAVEALSAALQQKSGLGERKLSDVVAAIDAVIRREMQEA